MFVDLYTQPLRFTAFVSNEFPQSGIAESQHVLIIVPRDLGYKGCIKLCWFLPSYNLVEVQMCVLFPGIFFFFLCTKILVGGDFFLREV